MAKPPVYRDGRCLRQFSGNGQRGEPQWRRPVDERCTPGTLPFLAASERLGWVTHVAIACQRDVDYEIFSVTCTSSAFSTP
jgi:hypothetical protein